MNKKPQILVLIDGNALIHRAYHALPPLTSQSGELVNAVYGFSLTLLSVLEKFHPEYIATSFDLAGPTFRHEKSAEYKATRVKAPDDLYAQIPRVKEVTKAFNIPIYELPSFEADDCIGTLARQAEKENVEVIIVTGDSDELQLVTPQVKVFMLRKGVKDIVLYDEKAVQEKYGFSASQIPDYKGLAGDASDNIAGVNGIGAKTATNLLQQFGSVENIYANIASIKESVRKKLEAGRESAFLSKELGTIDTEAPITLDLSLCVTKDFDRSVVTKLFRELGFFSLIKKIAEGEQDTPDEKKHKKNQQKIKSQKILNEKDFTAFVQQYETIALYVEQEKETLFGQGIQAIHFSGNKESEGIVVWNEETKKFLQIFLEESTQKKIVYDAKYLMHLFHKEMMTLRGVKEDIMLSAYLLRSGGDVDFSHLILEEFGEEEIVSPAQKIFLLREIFQSRIETVSSTQASGKTLKTVLEKIELPLVPVLYTMEEEGIMLNTKKFESLSSELASELMLLEKNIYTLAGREFNINSPKQLATILFEDLHIPTTTIKKIKTGFSTASTELQKLAEYPIIEKIENYRELFKLKTTYIDTLPLLVGDESRLHTTFYQAVAATGRLSSADPNLQNIPARGEWSTRVRGSFEAKEGYVFVGADYSQVELRVMAHLSGDESLTTSFRTNEDVHTKTASVVFKVKPEEVTPDMRRQAKVFNFGIMYGMGAYGLSQSAKIDQKTAQDFIKAYFEKFAGVARYIETMKADAREKGFVETELGRRRYTPEITSKNVQVARAGERMAINMPVQGLAADIMKLAMIAVAERIEKDFRESVKMILQVHDELICEVREDQAEKFSLVVKEIMEHVYPLAVPLVVETVIGKNWGEI